MWVWRGWIKISQNKVKISQNKVKISQIKVKISQNKVKISHNYSQCLSPVHVFLCVFLTSSFFFPSRHFGGSVQFQANLKIFHLSQEIGPQFVENN